MPSGLVNIVIAPVIFPRILLQSVKLGIGCDRGQTERVIALKKSKFTEEQITYPLRRAEAGTSEEFAEANCQSRKSFFFAGALNG